MSMHFVTHPWEVQDVDDGTVVKLTEHDLRMAQIDELLELVLESGRPNLYLDLLEVRSLPSQVASKLFGLDRRLRATGGRLILSNLVPDLCEVLQVRKA
jgi:anti-anti-sigma regulatory factor